MGGWFRTGLEYPANANERQKESKGNGIHSRYHFVRYFIVFFRFRNCSFDCKCKWFFVFSSSAGGSPERELSKRNGGGGGGAGCRKRKLDSVADLGELTGPASPAIPNNGQCSVVFSSCVWIMSIMRGRKRVRSVRRCSMCTGSVGFRCPVQLSLSLFSYVLVSLSVARLFSSENQWLYVDGRTQWGRVDEDQERRDDRIRKARQTHMQLATFTTLDTLGSTITI